jgi:hypothetical protein
MIGTAMVAMFLLMYTHSYEIGYFGDHCATHFGGCCASRFGDHCAILGN